MGRLTQRDVLKLLAGSGVAAMAALVGGALIFSANSDRAAKQREETVISNGFTARSNEIAAPVVGNVVWDETVRHLDNHYDPAWARDNIGVFFANNGGYGRTYVLDGAGQLIFGMQDGALIAPHANLTNQIPPALITRVRAEESQRALAHLPVSYALRHPVQATAPAWIAHRLFIVTATLVAPDFGHARLHHRTAPIVVTARELDQNFLKAFSERYLLADLSLRQGPSARASNLAHATIFDARGAAIATLDWRPQTPGALLMLQILPWIAGLLVVVLTAMIMLFLRARHAARGLVASEQRTLHMANHDALTGLCNRVEVEKRVREALAGQAGAGAVGFALHCLDLDHFKHLNDTYGHQVGDEALREIGERLRTALRSHDLCARIGGDEFVILERIENKTEAVLLAARLITLLAAPLKLSVGLKTLGCSIGTALLEDDVGDPMELLRRADVALYRAKADGRGCNRFFDREMDAAAKSAQRLKEELRADLAMGRLHLLYQPQLHRSGEVVGLEALVRWNHAMDGAISPSVFVPLAEEAGLIQALGDFALRQAAIDSRRWPHLKVAVNISATQIQDPAFARHAAEIVASVGADPKRMEIELTEGVFFSNEDQAHATLTALHEAGFSLALDDFGTGYSSLSYLQRFPIDKVKIDRTFVKSLGRDRKADAFFAAIVRLAQALDMRVIAEGVETTEQWLRLTAAGCPKIQGYIASKPLAADDVDAFVHKAKSMEVALLPQPLLAAVRPA